MHSQTQGLIEEGAGGRPLDSPLGLGGGGGVENINKNNQHTLITLRVCHTYFDPISCNLTLIWVKISLILIMVLSHLNLASYFCGCIAKLCQLCSAFKIAGS